MKREYLIAAGIAAAALVGWLVWRKAGDTLATSLNPASDQNIAYQGTNGLLQGLGIIGRDQSLGTALYDAVDTVKGWFGYSEADRIAAAGTTNSKPYDYGQGGTAGVPWRLDDNPQGFAALEDFHLWGP